MGRVPTIDDNEHERRDNSLVLRTLDTLEKTVSILETTVSALQKAVDTLQASTTTLTETVFGKQDPTNPLRRIPGIRDRVAVHESYLKWGGAAALAMLAIGTAHNLGVPTETIGKAIHALTGW